MRQLRTIVLTIGGAVLGVIAGRWYARARRDDGGLLAPMSTSANAAIAPVAPITLQEVVPGVILAFRMHGESWRRLGLPVWFVAFAVNGLLHAYERELSPVFRALGLTWSSAPAGNAVDVIDVPHRPVPDGAPDPASDPGAPSSSGANGASIADYPVAASTAARNAASLSHAPPPAVPSADAVATAVRPAVTATDTPVWSPAGPAVVPQSEQADGPLQAPTDEGTFIPSEP